MHVLGCLRVVMSACWTIACNSNCCIFVLLPVDCACDAVKLELFLHHIVCPMCRSLVSGLLFRLCQELLPTLCEHTSESLLQRGQVVLRRRLNQVGLVYCCLTCINRPLRLHFRLCWGTVWLAWLGRCWIGLHRTLKLGSGSVLTSWTDPNRH